ncbi:hypothetical protein RchiOBHm_Chr2g0115281 [Rosa chinensis]|uniref:Uncharacterized protein n=1 Tax=Rosa chinensis TaxID=74649 RepID=A0A2P6RR16_ROSCH|nr:hypothetical protein RchiOBHm_Chr2g0115281 [Rosa chinensis]
MFIILEFCSFWPLQCKYVVNDCSVNLEHSFVVENWRASCSFRAYKMNYFSQFLEGLYIKCFLGIFLKVLFSKDL